MLSSSQVNISNFPFATKQQLRLQVLVQLASTGGVIVTSYNSSMEVIDSSEQFDLDLYSDSLEYVRFSNDEDDLLLLGSVGARLQSPDKSVSME